MNGPSTIATASVVERGATMSTEYVERKQLVTLISVDELREFQSSMNEEFWIFSFGGFLASGSFWIVLERFFSNEIDTVFWVCVVALVAGGVIGLIGYRQLRRRKTKIGRMIDGAETSAKTRAAAATSTLTAVPRREIGR